MRGTREEQSSMFSYAMLERRMDRQVDALYAKTCRPSIAPERRLRALPLQILYSIPAERRLIEQLDCNLLFRWFVGLEMDDAVWDVTVFTKNRERPIAGEVSKLLLAEVVMAAQARDLPLGLNLLGLEVAGRNEGFTQIDGARRIASNQGCNLVLDHPTSGYEIGFLAPDDEEAWLKGAFDYMYHWSRGCMLYAPQEGISRCSSNSRSPRGRKGLRRRHSRF